MSLHRLPAHKNEWARAIQAALSKQAEEVPKDWLNSDQVAEQLGVNRTQALKFLKRLKDEGLVEVEYFKICVNKDFGLVRKVPHYRLPKKELTKTPKSLLSHRPHSQRR